MRFSRLSLFVLASSLSAVAFAADNAPAAAATVAPMAKLAPATAAAPALASFTPAQQAAIEQILHNYLITHPEVLIEASQALQMKQQQIMQEKAAKMIPTLASSLLHDPSSPAVGNLKGTVSVVEFFDYQCPHCKAMSPEIAAVLAQNKDVKVIYKELPIFGADSEFAAKAALAAQRQGKFEAFHEALLKSQGRLPNQTVLDIAKSVGLDVNKLQADMNQPEYGKELAANAELASQLGIAGTPAFVVMATDAAGKVKSQFIPGQTNAAELTKAIAAVK